MMKTPRQFDFGRKWKKKIRPLLDHPDVVKALTGGLMLGDPNYREGDPPWEYGRGPLNGQRATPGCLSWYQPRGMCHYIAPFSWKLGTLLFPEREWGFITSDHHTVVIGYAGNWEEPEWVMDILLCREDDRRPVARSRKVATLAVLQVVCGICGFVLHRPRVRL